MLALLHASEALLASHAESTEVEAPLDTAFLEHVGVASQLPRWREIAARSPRAA
jgi:hypothetical protein